MVKNNDEELKGLVSQFETAWKRRVESLRGQVYEIKYIPTGPEKLIKGRWLVTDYQAVVPPSPEKLIKGRWLVTDYQGDAPPIPVLPKKGAKEDLAKFLEKFDKHLEVLIDNMEELGYPENIIESITKKMLNSLLTELRVNIPHFPVNMTGIDLTETKTLDSLLAATPIATSSPVSTATAIPKEKEFVNPKTVSHAVSSSTQPQKTQPIASQPKVAESIKIPAEIAQYESRILKFKKKWEDRAHALNFNDPKALDFLSDYEDKKDDLFESINISKKLPKDKIKKLEDDLEKLIDKIYAEKKAAFKKTEVKKDVVSVSPKQSPIASPTPSPTPSAIPSPTVRPASPEKFSSDLHSHANTVKPHPMIPVSSGIKENRAASPTVPPMILQQFHAEKEKHPENLAVLKLGQEGHTFNIGRDLRQYMAKIKSISDLKLIPSDIRIQYNPDPAAWKLLPDQELPKVMAEFQEFIKLLKEKGVNNIIIESAREDKKKPIPPKLIQEFEKLLPDSKPKLNK